MWKDFFYYSKSERRAILFLTGMGILLLVSGTWIHSVHQQEVPRIDSICTDSFGVQMYRKAHFRDSLRWKKRRTVPVLADFDPNTTDSAGFCRLGLPPFLAQRIVNYREKGGIFRKPSDFSRVYGLSEEQYNRLLPYIVIDQERLGNLLEARAGAWDKANRIINSDDSLRLGNTESGQGVSTDSNHFKKSHYIAVKKYTLGTVIDLNTADTTALKGIPGIGSGLAKMIIAYRNRLGGYSNVDQLQEIAGLDTSVNKWFKIDTGIFRPLKVNRAGLDQLRNHPYMNFYKARAILEFRRKRGKIEGLPQLSMFQEFTEKDLQRLQPYLDFN